MFYSSSGGGVRRNAGENVLHDGKTKTKAKEQKNEHEGKIDKMKLPLLPHGNGTIRASSILALHTFSN